MHLYGVLSLVLYARWISGPYNFIVRGCLQQYGIVCNSLKTISSSTSHILLWIFRLWTFPNKKNSHELKIRINDVIHVITSVLIFYFTFHRIELPGPNLSHGIILRLSWCYKLHLAITPWVMTSVSTARLENQGSRGVKIDLYEQLNQLTIFH